MFRKDGDFEAFERVMVLAHQRQPIRVLSCCVLSVQPLALCCLAGARRSIDRLFSGG